MTIPIIPGPFDFMSRLGGALSGVASDIERRRLQKNALAQQDAELILRIVEQTGNPEMLNAPGVQETLKRAGIDAGQLQVQLTEQQQRAQRVGELPLPLRSLALGLPDESDLLRRTEENRAAISTAQATGLRSNITADVLRGVQPKGAAARAVAQVPSEPIAAATEEAQEAQLQQRTTAAQADTKIQELVRKNVEDPKSDFGYWSSVAAAGFLPLYVQRLQVFATTGAGARQEQQRRYDLLIGPIEDARRQYRELLDDWTNKRANAVQIAGGDAKKVQEWEAQNPQPNLTQVMNRALIDAAIRLFPDAEQPVAEYFKQLREASGLVRSNIPEARLQALQQTAEGIAAGTVSQADAEAVIQRRSNDPVFEVAELRRMVAALKGQPQ
jgi:hypothetical protein